MTEQEDDIYNEEYLEKLTDSDEVEPEEEGFMHGYEDESDPSECAQCKKMLRKDFVEEEIKRKVYRFCSEKCAYKFERKKEHV